MEATATTLLDAFRALPAPAQMAARWQLLAPRGKLSVLGQLLPPAERSALANLAEIVAGSYQLIRDQYGEALFDAVRRYFATDKRSRVYLGEARSAFMRAVRDFLPMAFWRGFTDGGGTLDDAGDSDYGWIDTRAADELQRAASFWERAREDRPASEDAPDISLWLRTLDQVYANGKARAKGGLMLTFTRMQSSKEPCSTCKRLEGQRHTARWWAQHNYIPGPDADFECGGWNCSHRLIDDKGEAFIPLEFA